MRRPPLVARQSWFARGLRALAAAVMAALALGCLAPPQPMSAQAAITVTDAPAPQVVFGESVTFNLSARSSDPITGIALHLQARGEPEITWTQVTFEPGREVDASLQVNLVVTSLPPFSPVDYWWTLEDSAGNTLTTPPNTFYYEDNRFTWRRLTHGAVSVNWYAGDEAFGQQALAVAGRAYATANRDIRAPLPKRLDLYLYANERDVQAALGRIGYVWANGHADVKLGVVVVVVAPDLTAEFNLSRDIPHELTHILIYEATGANYGHVPTWLNEGLAMLNQEQPETDAAGLLAGARDARRPLAFAALCGGFPSDPDQARLAYAQSESFVRYIRTRYGSEGLNRLLGAYGAGAECSAGVETVLGLPLARLDQAWQRDVLYSSSLAARWYTLRPWLLLAALVLLGPLLFLALTLRARPR